MSSVFLPRASKHNTPEHRHLCVPCRHLLFCRVTLGKSFLQFNAMKMAHSPPGHHSVTGRPSVNGLALSEYVIYRGEQVSHVNSAGLFFNTGLFVRDFDLANAGCRIEQLATSSRCFQVQTTDGSVQKIQL